MLKALLAAVAATAAFLLSAVPAAAETPCWRKLINDWYDGRIDNTYPIACYRQAIREAPEDVQAYSSLREDLTRALQGVLRKPPRGGTRARAVPGGAKGRAGAPRRVRPAGRRVAPMERTDDERGPVIEAINDLGPRNADSVPLPLIILASLALLLLAGGAAGMVARRVQARRVPVSSSPASERPPSS